MRKSQANRRVIAARTPDARPSIGTVGTNPALRVVTPVTPGGNIGRHFGPGTRGGSGSRGYQSDWARSPYAPFGGWR